MRKVTPCDMVMASPSVKVSGKNLNIHPTIPLNSRHMIRAQNIMGTESQSNKIVVDTLIQQSPYII